MTLIKSNLIFHEKNRNIVLEKVYSNEDIFNEYSKHLTIRRNSFVDKNKTNNFI
jgi:hypothetical protein